MAKPEEERLREQALDFAQDLTSTVQAVVPTAAGFRAVGTGSRFVVQQDPAEGIVLHVAGTPMLRLEVRFQCTFDHRDSFLAVEWSEMKVSAIAGPSEPLVRWDYLRTPRSGMASAHVQVHAHRDAVTYVLTRCGSSTVRAKRRRKEIEGGSRVPQLSDLHLPVGGPRFRPCLEDILQMLIDEFGIEAADGAQEALASGRAEWRRKQLAAAVRDCPERVVEVLESLGYRVTLPETGHAPERLEKLTAL